MTDENEPIAIACSECTNQVQKTYEWLLENELKCPACGHVMVDESKAVTSYIRQVRAKLSEAGVRRDTA
jgi:Zn finger protein HypA/HybF involved in hydrogenase expression